MMRFLKNIFYGTGKSYSENLTADDMQVDNFVSDKLELTDILRKRFNQELIRISNEVLASVQQICILQRIRAREINNEQKSM